MEQSLFVQYLLFILIGMTVLALGLPLLIWRNTSETRRMLGEIMEAHELASAQLHRLERRLEELEHGVTERICPAPSPGPDEDYGPDEEYCPIDDCAPESKNSPESPDMEADSAPTSESDIASDTATNRNE